MLLICVLKQKISTYIGGLESSFLVSLVCAYTLQFEDIFCVIAEEVEKILETLPYCVCIVVLLSGIPVSCEIFDVVQS